MRTGPGRPPEGKGTDGDNARRNPRGRLSGRGGPAPAAPRKAAYGLREISRISSTCASGPGLPLGLGTAHPGAWHRETEQPSQATPPYDGRRGLGWAEGPPGPPRPATSAQGSRLAGGLCPGLRLCPRPRPRCPHRRTCVHSRCRLSSLRVTFPPDLAGSRGPQGHSTPWTGVSPFVAGSGDTAGPATVFALHRGPHGPDLGPAAPPRGARAFCPRPGPANE